MQYNRSGVSQLGSRLAVQPSLIDRVLPQSATPPVPLVKPSQSPPSMLDRPFGKVPVQTSPARSTPLGSRLMKL